ncbi:hypothetical protein [Streptomyces sp. YU58]|uniref:hypothetical protein n=1 Tax=Streptomyces sp. SX92 TaxID=3158972 RepID=UPI0027B97947|nr:hypothetical protein [Streptomyces coralus]WLW52700.1 hypothetical protein QU709_15480 [Streptomyces coralus]
MGFWGYFVVGRAERPLAELKTLPNAAGMVLRVSAPDGWQVWEYQGEGDVGKMSALAERTGSPALFGYVMDSASVVVEAAGPRSGVWTACLARAAMAAHLGVDTGDDDGDDGESGEIGEGGVDEGAEEDTEGVVDAEERPVLEDYFLHPRDAAERAVAWAAEAGHVVDAGPLLDVLFADPDTDAGELAENLFFRLLDRLGVVPL